VENYVVFLSPVFYNSDQRYETNMLLHDAHEVPITIGK